MIKFSQVQKKDIPLLAKIYAQAYNKQWESWTKKTSEAILMYRYKKPVKIKVIYNNILVGAFFSDIKPLYNGNVLNDGDVIVSPIYQKLWIGKQLFIYGIDYAIKKFHVVGRDFYTFKDSYQYDWYTRIGFSPSNTWVLVSGKTNEVLKKLKEE